MSSNKTFHRTRSIRRKSLPQLPQKSPIEYRRRSLSSGIQSLFRRKRLYTITNIEDGGEMLELYSFNKAEDRDRVYTALPNDSPRIWKVRHRNSISESVVENLTLEPVEEHPQLKKKEKLPLEKLPWNLQREDVYYTCTDKFDAIGLFRDFIMYEFVELDANPEGRNLTLKRGGNRCECRGCQDSVYPDSQKYDNTHTSKSCSTISPTSSCSSSVVSSRKSSLTADDDLNTSYWDLRIPEDDFTYAAVNRRNSWSPGGAKLPRPSIKRWITPKLHVTGQYSKQCTCPTCNEKVRNVNSPPVTVRNNTRRRERPPVRQRSQSETEEGIMINQSKVIHRSRSADYGKRPRSYRRLRRMSSLVVQPFSDIEASDASDVEPIRSVDSSILSSRRNSQNGSSGSIEICSSSSEDKDSGYHRTDESEKTERNKDSSNDDKSSNFHDSQDEKQIESVKDDIKYDDAQDKGVKEKTQQLTKTSNHTLELVDKTCENIWKMKEDTTRKDKRECENNERDIEPAVDYDHKPDIEQRENEPDMFTDDEGEETEEIIASFTLPSKKESPPFYTSNTIGKREYSLPRIRQCHGNNLEFRSMSMEDLLFCSGRRNSGDEPDDVKQVFDAINKEAERQENKDKDMMVVFLVGGELKVLRRAGATGHGDRIRSDLPSMTRQDLAQSNGNHDHVVYTNQSSSEYKRPRPKSEIIIGRSQSFAGMAEPSPQKKSSQGAMVLGESFRHHRGPTMPAPKAAPVGKVAVSASFRKSPKVPKIPRPNRALLMFQSVKKGIREFIDATKEDIDDLQSRDLDGTSTAQGRLHETDKQLKSAERYLKRLEFHMSKLDELHEYYLVQQQLREGVRTMHKAYVTSPGNQRNTLSNVKYGYKECTQTMCNIEAQLESMMGTFNCKLKGIAGFARLCPGDVFEVTTRHGTQKWKTKGRIEKTGNQKWDIPEYNFKAVVGDIINIKGVEVRAFKSILLGQKSCETKDLFSANPQLMTVSINVNGSLKLSIVITWNPLDGVDESVVFMDTPMRSQGTPRRRPVSVIAINGQHQQHLQDDQRQFDYERRHSNPASMQQSRDDNFILRSNTSPPPHTNNLPSYHGLDSPHVVGSRTSDHLPDAYHYTQLGPVYSQSVGNIPGGFSSSPALHRDTTDLSHSANQSSVFSSSLPPVINHLHFPSVSLRGLNGARDSDSCVSNIEDVVHNLSSALEDYHGQYTELNKLEELVKLANKFLRKQFRNSSRSSSISVSIEDALEAFDFLDTEETTEDPQSPTINPESTAKTADSGIESLAQRLSEDAQLGSSLGSSPVPPSLGNEEVDQCLMYHLTYCERLLENLGAFGPLKCREIYALDKIQKQSTIIESLLKVAKSGSQVDLHPVMASLCHSKALKEFWVKCTEQNSLFVSPDRLLLCMEQKFAAVIVERFNMDPSKVCQHVITRVLDIPDYEAEQGRPYFVITLHQFMLFFNDEGGLKHVEEVAEELKLVERLMSGNSDMVIKAILTLRDSIPTAPCLKVIGMLLVTLDKEVEQCTISYLNLIQKKKENRDRAMVVFLEGLEDRTSEIRAGACAALAILEASESIDQLVYLWQSDSSQLVQTKAKEALFSMDEEGKRAFEEARLSKHGFQGIHVHKATFM